MRRIARIARIALGLLIAVLLVAVAGVAGVVWFTLPGGDATASIPGLSAPIEVTVDDDGIPRVRAANERDAAAGLGWLHARDRMFQMDLMRRNASGELAELAGARAMPLDRMMRTLGLRIRAEADLAGLAPDVRAVLDAYASGVNAWIAEHGRFSAIEFVVLGAPRPWTEVDSLLWGKTMGVYLSGNWREELARARLDARLPGPMVNDLWPPSDGADRPDARADAAVGLTATRLASVLPAFPEPFTLPSEASNAWAVDGAHSTTGKPLLAGDPHLAYGLPGIWYLARIETPGNVLAGATAPGVPFVVIGRNSHIAWTFTTTGADTQDLFVETPAGDNAYATPDGPRPFATRTERIKVRDGPDESWTVRETRHGPVISDLVGSLPAGAQAGAILSLAAANLSPGDEAAEGLLALNRAGGLAEAGQAAARISSPVQNLLVADHDGIGLFVTGRVPIRRSGDGERPVGGADGQHDWIGWASGEQLPHVVHPRSGQLVNANERVAPLDFPVFLGKDWYGDWRARRIRELLAQSDKHGPADFARMQIDVDSVFARELLPRLRRTQAPDGLPRRALALLMDWQGSMMRDAPQPLIFNAWMLRFNAALLAPHDIPSAQAGSWPEFVRFVLTAPDGSAVEGRWCGGDCGKLLAKTLADAVTDLAGMYGDDPAQWRWGIAHPTIFAHPLLQFVPALGDLVAGRIASGGDETTIGRGGMRTTGAGPNRFAAVHGASFRGVYDLADLDRSLFIVAPGQSGHPFSGLARNMIERWRAGATVALGPRPDHVSATIRLMPSG